MLPRILLSILPEVLSRVLSRVLAVLVSSAMLGFMTDVAEKAMARIVQKNRTKIETRLLITVLIEMTSKMITGRMKRKLTVKPINVLRNLTVGKPTCAPMTMMTIVVKPGTSIPNRNAAMRIALGATTKAATRVTTKVAYRVKRGEASISTIIQARI